MQAYKKKVQKKKKYVIVTNKEIYWGGLCTCIVIVSRLNY